MGTKYSTVSISGYNSSPPADDGTQTAANQVKWSTIKTKLPDPLKTAIEAINSQLVTYSDFGVRQVSTSDTTTAADYMKTVEIAPGVSTSVTVSLGDAAGMTAGYIVTVKNSSAITQTVGRATAGNTINGSAFDFSLPPKASAKFKVIGAETGYIVESYFGNAVYDPVDHRKVVVWSASGVSSNATRTGTLPNYDFRTMTQTKGADVASGGTINLDSATGDLVDVTGTTTVSAVTLAEGKEATVRFVASLILTNNSNLLLPGAANITTVAGDVAIFRGYSGGVVRCVSYMPVTLPPTRPILGTQQTSTSGTSIDFTGIPAWVKRITITFSGVSTNGTSNPMAQIGDAGGIEPTGYLGSAAISTTFALFTTGFGISASTAATSVIHGAGILTLMDAATNTWAWFCVVGYSNAAGVAYAAGVKSLSATLDRVRITTVGGADTFDAGAINIMYE